MPQSMPGPCMPVLGCLKAVGSRADAERACAPPIPASPTGVQTGSRALRETLLLQVKYHSRDYALREPRREADVCGADAACADGGGGEHHAGEGDNDREDELRGRSRYLHGWPLTGDC